MSFPFLSLTAFPGLFGFFPRSEFCVFHPPRLPLSRYPAGSLPVDPRSAGSTGMLRAGFRHSQDLLPDPGGSRSPREELEKPPEPWKTRRERELALEPSIPPAGAGSCGNAAVWEQPGALGIPCFPPSFQNSAEGASPRDPIPKFLRSRALAQLPGLLIPLLPKKPLRDAGRGFGMGFPGVFLTRGAGKSMDGGRIGGGSSFPGELCPLPWTAGKAIPEPAGSAGKLGMFEFGVYGAAAGGKGRALGSDWENWDNSWIKPSLPRGIPTHNTGNSRNNRSCSASPAAAWSGIWDVGIFPWVLFSLRLLPRSPRGP